MPELSRTHLVLIPSYNTGERLFSTVAAARAQEVVIERGLAPGERVAASGAFKLQDAMLVAVADPPSRRTAGAR